MLMPEGAARTADGQYHRKKKSCGSGRTVTAGEGYFIDWIKITRNIKNLEKVGGFIIFYQTQGRSRPAIGRAPVAIFLWCYHSCRQHLRSTTSCIWLAGRLGHAALE